MIHIIFTLKQFSEPSGPVNRDTVIMEDSNPIKSQHKIKAVRTTLH